MAISVLDEVLEVIRLSGKSVNQMSKESGVSRSTICDWFRGDTSPTLQNAEAVLNAIGYTITLKEMGKENASNKKGSNHTLQS